MPEGPTIVESQIWTGLPSHLSGEIQDNLGAILCVAQRFRGEAVDVHVRRDFAI